MKKKRKMSQTNTVHDALNCDDILSDILLRLPPDTVFKLIIVSKRWLQCICSYTFCRNYVKRWKVDPHLLGFFVSNILYLGTRPGGPKRPAAEPALLLLSTCIEGDDLKYSKNLKQLGYFIDSSKGILLCGRHPKTYFVWDPVSKQQHKLPRPRVYFEEFCMAFVVEDSLDESSLCYKVIRAKCESHLQEVKTVTLETYYSKTKTWYYSTLTCEFPLCLCPWTVATVIGNTVYWYESSGKIAFYDSGNEDSCNITVIELPGLFDYDERVLGESSDGLLQYGRSCSTGMQIWVLVKDGNNGNGYLYSTKRHWDTRNGTWVLIYSINFKTMWKRNPKLMTAFRTCTKSTETQIVSFLPQNSKSVYIRCDKNIFLCHLETLEVEVVHYNGRSSSLSWDFSKVVPYFKPSWPPLLQAILASFPSL